MGFQIDDGKGQGFSAQVNRRNQLVTRSTSNTEEHKISAADGEAYVANTTDTADTLTTLNGNTYDLLYLENTSSTKILVIEIVGFSASANGGILKFIKNPVKGTIANANNHIPLNSNFASGNEAEATAFSWDEVGIVGISGLSGGDNLASFLTTSNPALLPVSGAFILGRGNSISFQYINNTGGNSEVSVQLRFYYDDPEG